MVAVEGLERALHLGHVPPRLLPVQGGQVGQVGPRGVGLAGCGQVLPGYGELVGGGQFLSRRQQLRAGQVLAGEGLVGGQQVGRGVLVGRLGRQAHQVVLGGGAGPVLPPVLVQRAVRPGLLQNAFV